jgi:hypothetical protein
MILQQIIRHQSILHTQQKARKRCHNFQVEFQHQIFTFMTLFMTKVT